MRLAETVTFGGFGGAINASYAMNAMVHNTQWVTGHFHLIFGGTVVIMYMGAAYALWPKMTGRELASVGMAASFPIGILLALGQRSTMPMVTSVSVSSSSSGAVCR